VGAFRPRCYRYLTRLDSVYLPFSSSHPRPRRALRATQWMIVSLARHDSAQTGTSDSTDYIIRDTLSTFAVVAGGGGTVSQRDSWTRSSNPSSRQVLAIGRPRRDCSGLTPRYDRSVIPRRSMARFAGRREILIATNARARALSAFRPQEIARSLKITCGYFVRGSPVLRRCKAISLVAMFATRLP